MQTVFQGEVVVDHWTGGFTVELHDEEPSVEEISEDVVEVSFRPGSDAAALVL